MPLQGDELPRRPDVGTETQVPIKQLLVSRIQDAGNSHHTLCMLRGAGGRQVAWCRTVTITKCTQGKVLLLVSTPPALLGLGSVISFITRWGTGGGGCQGACPGAVPLEGGGDRSPIQVTPVGSLSALLTCFFVRVCVEEKTVGHQSQEAHG